MGGGAKFDGRCDELKGFVLDCGQLRHAGVYNSTMDEIVNHIRTNLLSGELVARTILTGVLAVPEKPVEPTNGDNMDKDIWKAEITDFMRQKRALKQSMQSAYGLVYSQCTPNLQANLQGLKEFVTFEAHADLLALLKGIKSLVFNFESTKSLPDALVLGMKNFY